MEFRVRRAPRIETEITVPGDKSISHRAVILAALSNGICVLRGFLPSED
ncbi:MAG: 3-phosphoshikimate 1-carboxyvinyltransferase, partial [Chthoniobacterales bacterium]|nr:3-phosphoshikimate 1-carboxyvinyltransferase [Chthoniobacterales bacterium]